MVTIDKNTHKGPQKHTFLRRKFGVSPKNCSVADPLLGHPVKHQISSEFTPREILTSSRSPCTDFWGVTFRRKISESRRPGTPAGFFSTHAPCASARAKIAESRGIRRRKAICHRTPAGAAEPPRNPAFHAQVPPGTSAMSRRGWGLRDARRGPADGADSISGRKCFVNIQMMFCV